MIQISLPVGTGVTIANQLYYSVPAGMLIPLRVQYESRFIRKTFPNQIGRYNSTWATDTTSNTGQPVSEWIPIGLDLFAIHPIDDIGGAALNMAGVAEPTLLVNPSDTVFIPVEYASAIADLTAQVLVLRESAAEFQRCQDFYTTYANLAMKASIWRGLVMPLYSAEEARQHR